MCQGLEFVVEMRILAEMKIKNQSQKKNMFCGKKVTSILFSVNIKMVDL